MSDENTMPTTTDETKKEGEETTTPVTPIPGAPVETPAEEATV